MKKLLTLLLLVTTQVFGQSGQGSYNIPGGSGGGGGITNGYGITNMSLTAEIFGTNNAFRDMTNTIPFRKGQLGVSYFGNNFMHLWVSSAATRGAWTNGFNIIGGISLVGDENYGDPTILSTHWKLNGGLAGNAAAGDSLFSLANFSTNRFNSGSGFNLGVMGVNALGKAEEMGSYNSAAWLHVPTNRIGSLSPGNVAMAFNYSEHIKNFMINSPGASGFDSGSYTYVDVDLANKLFRIPIWQTGVYQPSDTPYTFNVSGVSVPPVAFDVYSHNGTLWIITGISLSGSAPNMLGIILMTPFPAKATTASGTLTKVQGSGDATITFDSSSANPRWLDALLVSPVSGNVQIASNMFVTNLITTKNLRTASLTASTIVGANATKDLTSLAAGVNGDVLTADSGQSLGFKWSTSSANPVKTYAAFLTQFGAASAPTVDAVAYNTLSGPIVWTYTGVGEYTGTLTGAFLVNKVSETSGFIGIANSTAWQIRRISDNTIKLYNYTVLTGATDSVMTRTWIKVEIYP